MIKILPTNRFESGFTAVELLVTLFVAAAFLTAGYQLYTLIIKDSGQARADSRASSVAYDYMRRYSASVVSPCVASTPLSNSALSVAGLTGVTVTVTISCPYASTTSVSKVDILLTYNSQQAYASTQTMEYATYVTL